MELFVYLCTFNVKSNQLMKNILLILIASVSLISCQKEWTCSCLDAAGYNKNITVKASNASNAVKKCNKTYNDCTVY